MTEEWFFKSFIKLMLLSDWEFKHICIPRFVKAFENCPIKSVEDIVNFNEGNKEKAMPERKFTFFCFFSPHILTTLLRSVHRAK